MEPWVEAQHRTMARWVAAKTEGPVPDLAADLADGLRLVALLNTVLKDHNQDYALALVHRKPVLHVQKVENVNEVLEFCRIILHINLVGVSADAIVRGDTKAILGLIWSLFVYSSSRAMALLLLQSLGEIKGVLLEWLSKVCRRRALPKVTNFSKDWSLHAGGRPDLILTCLLEHYLHVKIPEKGKKTDNLEHVMAVAHEHKVLPLAMPEDFNVLVPDEKVVLFYVLEWYTVFELAQPQVSPMALFFVVVLDTVKLRNRYETRALHLLNHINNCINLGDKSDTDPFWKEIEELQALFLHIQANLARIGFASPQYTPLKLLMLLHIVDRLQELDPATHFSCTEPISSEKLSGLADFLAAVELQKNKKNLSFSDVRRFVRLIVDESVDDAAVSSFLQLVPSRRLLNRSTSDESIYSSDDDTPIFDSVLRTLEDKLTGNYNKLYDIDEFCARLVGGFKV